MFRERPPFVNFFSDSILWEAGRTNGKWRKYERRAWKYGEMIGLRDNGEGKKRKRERF